jgi:hypothetical protein
MIAYVNRHLRINAAKYIDCRDRLLSASEKIRRMQMLFLQVKAAVREAQTQGLAQKAAKLNELVDDMQSYIPSLEAKLSETLGTSSPLILNKARTAVDTFESIAKSCQDLLDHVRTVQTLSMLELEIN